MKVEGDRHSKRQSTDVLKVHTQVIQHSVNECVHIYICTHQLSCRREISTWWIQVIQRHSTLWRCYYPHVLINQTACLTVWKKIALTCTDTWSHAPSTILSKVICVNTPTRCFICTCNGNAVSKDDGKNDAVTNVTDLPSLMENGVNSPPPPPPKTAQEGAGIGKTLIIGEVDLPHK